MLAVHAGQEAIHGFIQDSTSLFHPVGLRFVVFLSDVVLELQFVVFLLNLMSLEHCLVDLRVHMMSLSIVVHIQMAEELTHRILGNIWHDVLLEICHILSRWLVLCFGVVGVLEILHVDLFYNFLSFR